LAIEPRKLPGLTVGIFATHIRERVLTIDKVKTLVQILDFHGDEGDPQNSSLAKLLSRVGKL